MSNLEALKQIKRAGCMYYVSPHYIIHLSNQDTECVGAFWPINTALARRLGVGFYIE